MYSARESTDIARNHDTAKPTRAPRQHRDPDLQPRRSGRGGDRQRVGADPSPVRGDRRGRRIDRSHGRRAADVRRQDHGHPPGEQGAVRRAQHGDSSGRRHVRRLSRLRRSLGAAAGGGGARGLRRASEGGRGVPRGAGDRPCGTHLTEGSREAHAGPVLHARRDDRPRYRRGMRTPAGRQDRALEDASACSTRASATSRTARCGSGTAFTSRWRSSRSLWS